MIKQAIEQKIKVLKLVSDKKWSIQFIIYMWCDFLKNLVDVVAVFGADLVVVHVAGVGVLLGAFPADLSFVVHVALVA